jgi:hypothetical protein
MEQQIRIGEQNLTLEFGLIDDVINVDDLTKIDTSNIFGESVTISAAVNRIGLMMSEVGANLAGLKLDCKFYENQYRNRLRAQASKSGGSYIVIVDGEKISVKITEKALETCYDSEPDWLVLKKDIINTERNYNSLSSLYWAMQEKSRKLNGLISGTTPEEYIAGIIEGKVNGILIGKGGVSKKAPSLGK